MGSINKNLGSVLAIGLLLVGCGVGTGRRSLSSNSSLTTTDPSKFAVTAFSPAEGAVAALPTSVIVMFNQADISSTAANPAYYNLSCAGNVFQASSVQYTSGQNFVTVQLPAVGTVSLNSTCYFSISPNIMNNSGYSTVGSRSAAYQIGSSGSSGSASSAAAGGGGGVAFTENASTLLLLSGLNLNPTTSVMALQGLWQENFRSGGTVVSGTVHGDTSGALGTSLTCPAGMRITGLKGRAGSYLDAVGIVCKDSTQANYYESSIVGGSGGSTFSITCPGGTFAAGLTGRAGTAMDQIALLCK